MVGCLLLRALRTRRRSFARSAQGQEQNFHLLRRGNSRVAFSLPIAARVLGESPSRLIPFTVSPSCMCGASLPNKMQSRDAKAVSAAIAGLFAVLAMSNQQRLS